MLSNEPKQHVVEDLPDYDSPPVIEVVSGIQFEPLPLTVPLFGAFWQSIRHDYPFTEEKEPLLAVREPVGEDEIAPEVRPLSFDLMPLPRIFYIDKSGNWVIQLQKDRFLSNWRKNKAEDEYPRFPVVFHRFSEAWGRFQEFCRGENLPEPKINQLELTYINHIPRGSGWSEVSDVSGLFPDLGWRPNHAFLPLPRAIGWNLTFVLPERRGRLNTALRYGVRQADRVPVLLFELTARGVPDGGDIADWFTLARTWIVRGFTDVTDERVQRDVWRRKR